jgi:hypothetical protein
MRYDFYLRLGPRVFYTRLQDDFLVTKAGPEAKEKFLSAVNRSAAPYFLVPSMQKI